MNIRVFYALLIPQVYIFICMCRHMGRFYGNLAQMFLLSQSVWWIEWDICGHSNNVERADPGRSRWKLRTRTRRIWQRCSEVKITAALVSVQSLWSYLWNDLGNAHQIWNWHESEMLGHVSVLFGNSVSKNRFFFKLTPVLQANNYRSVEALHYYFCKWLYNRHSMKL